jgi:hypothetical protein
MQTPKLLAAAVAGLLFSAPILAQDDDMQAKFEAKISEEWVSNGNWVLDFDEAKARAKAENKIISRTSRDPTRHDRLVRHWRVVHSPPKSSRPGPMMSSPSCTSPRVLSLVQTRISTRITVCAGSPPSCTWMQTARS